MAFNRTTFSQQEYKGPPGDVTAGKFSELLLKIEDGDFPKLAGKLVITRDLGLVVTTLQELTVQIYPDIADIKNKSMD